MTMVFVTTRSNDSGTSEELIFIHESLEGAKRAATEIAEGVLDSLQGTDLGMDFYEEEDVVFIRIINTRNGDEHVCYTIRRLIVFI